MTKSENIDRCRRIIKIMLAAGNGQVKAQLNEMAMPLKDFTERVEGVQYELARNWCLCKWCQTFNPDNRNFRHWRKELSTLMDYVMTPSLKNGMRKERHLRKIMLDIGDFSKQRAVLKIIRDKFSDEHIEDVSQIEAVARDFAGKAGEFVHVLASESTSRKRYVSVEFGVE